MTRGYSVMTVVALASAMWAVCATGPASGHTQRPSPSRDLVTTTGRRLALVIGNDAYKLAPLQNARNDAASVASALVALGFEVTRAENTGRQTLATAVAKFGDSLTSSDVALFYYAGHGVQIDNENYLIPVDFDAPSAAAVRLTAIKASDVHGLMEKARVAVLVFDACRTNPFAATRGSDGLAAMEPRGSLIAFATGAGQAASDESATAKGTNGLFTGALLQSLSEPGLSLREIFYRARQRVYDVSAGRQFPAVYDGLLGDLVLKPAVLQPTDVALRAELALWESISQSATPSLFEDYLRQYPNGRFRAVSESRLAALRAAAPPASPAHGTRWTSPETEAEMVWIRPGSFLRGSPATEAGRDADEVQTTQAMPSGFWLDAVEVTNRSYERFLMANPQWRRDRISLELHNGNYLADWPNSNPPSGSDRLPVANVSWHAADAFCKWRRSRLPSDVEWEYAARAGTTTAYWWGDAFDASRANTSDRVAEVGAPQRVNPFGLADMLGNVWEWTATPATTASRVIRGGSWSNGADFVRAANRNSSAAEMASPLVGFRCAR